jgi:hypothetical protein
MLYLKELANELAAPKVRAYTFRDFVPNGTDFMRPNAACRRGGRETASGR